MDRIEILADKWNVRAFETVRLSEEKYPAFVHKCDAGTKEHCFVQVVSYKNHRLTQLSNQTGELLLQCGSRYRVESSEWLIKKKQRRVGDKRSSDPYALALAPGKLMRETMRELRRVELDEFEHFGDTCLDRRRILIAERKREADILVDGHVRKKPAVLQDVADLSAQVNGVPVPSTAAVNEDITRSGPYQAIDQTERSRLPAAGLAEQHEDLAGHNIEGQAVYYSRSPGVETDVTKGDDRFAITLHR